MLTKTQLRKWTDYLRANPEKQGKHILSKADNSQQCCLGALCHVMGYPFEVNESGEKKYFGSDAALRGEASDAFGGGGFGYFWMLGMPPLQDYLCFSEANDRGVSWAEIADHADKYYPAIDDPVDRFAEFMTWANSEKAITSLIAA